MDFEMTPERRTGLIFGAIAAAVLGLIALVLTTSEPPGIRVTLLFKDVQGLREGDPVQMAGVPIGTVEGVELTSADQPVRVGVKVDIEHRKRIADNATAIIREAAPAKVPGQRAVEIVNAEQPGGPVRPGAVIEGRESEFDLTVWQLRGKVEQWGREIESTAEELTQAAREAYEEAQRRRPPSKPPTPQPPPTKPEPGDNADTLDAPSSSSPAGEPPLEGFHPEEAGREGFTPSPAEPLPSSPSTPSERQPWLDAETMESLAAAKEFVQSFVSSDEFKNLLARLMAFMARLNDEDNPPTPDEIIREWDGIQRDIQPLLEKLEKVDRRAATERLIAIIEDIEEEIGPILEYLEERQKGREPLAPPSYPETREPNENANEELIDV